MYLSSLAGHDFACDPNYERLGSETVKVLQEASSNSTKTIQIIFYAYIFRNFLKEHVSRALDYVLVERLMWVLL